MGNYFGHAIIVLSYLAYIFGSLLASSTVLELDPSTCSLADLHDILEVVPGDTILSQDSDERIFDLLNNPNLQDVWRTYHPKTLQLPYIVLSTLSLTLLLKDRFKIDKDKLKNIFGIAALCPNGTCQQLLDYIEEFLTLTKPLEARISLFLTNCSEPLYQLDPKSEFYLRVVRFIAESMACLTTQTDKLGEAPLPVLTLGGHDLSLLREKSLENIVNNSTSEIMLNYNEYQKLPHALHQVSPVAMKKFDRSFKARLNFYYPEWAKHFATQRPPADSTISRPAK